MHELPDTVEELNKHRAFLICVHQSFTMTPESGVKRMTKTQKVFLDQDLEPLERAKVRIYQDLGQGRELGCSIPPMTAVYEYRRSFFLEQWRDRTSGFENQAKVHEPLGFFNRRAPRKVNFGGHLEHQVS